MDIRQLRYFLGILEFQSFSRAAEHLNVAQSALSLHIRKMEESLGVRLLIRDPSGISPTAAGRELARHATAIVNQFDALERDLQQHRHSPQGSISIGVPSGIGRMLTTPLISAVNARFPDISLHVTESMTGDLTEWLEKGRIQLAILYDTPQLIADPKHLYDEALYFISGNLDLPASETIAMKDLINHPLAMPNRRHMIRSYLDQKADRNGIRLNVALEVDSLHSIMELVSAGTFCSILPPSAFADEWRQNKVRAYKIVEPIIRRSVFVACNAARGQQETVQAVETVIASTVRALLKEGEIFNELPRRA